MAVEAGLHFLRLLRVDRAPHACASYVAQYALVAEDLPGDDPATGALRRRAVGRVPDGRRLHADLVAARGGAAELTTLPAQPAVPTVTRAKVARRGQRLPPALGRASQRARRRASRRLAARTGSSTPSRCRPTCPTAAWC